MGGDSGGKDRKLEGLERGKREGAGRGRRGEKEKEEDEGFGVRDVGRLPWLAKWLEGLLPMAFDRDQ